MEQYIIDVNEEASEKKRILRYKEMCKSISIQVEKRRKKTETETT